MHRQLRADKVSKLRENVSGQRWIRKDLWSTAELFLSVCFYGVLLDNIHWQISKAGKFQISKPGKKTNKNCLCATSLQLVK